MPAWYKGFSFRNTALYNFRSPLLLKEKVQTYLSKMKGALCEDATDPFDWVGRCFKNQFQGKFYCRDQDFDTKLPCLPPTGREVIYAKNYTVDMHNFSFDLTGKQPT